MNTFLSLLLNRWVLTVSLFIALVSSGIWAVYNTPVDALPDLSENQVIVVSQWRGQSPQNIEDQVTYPLSTALQSLPKVKTVRSSSMMGVSMVTVIFEDDAGIYFARDRVSEKLAQVQSMLPSGVVTSIGPDATGLGHIFLYTLDHPDLSLTELRSLQDFVVKQELESLSGVAEVASVGGYVMQYQVVLDPVRMSDMGVGIQTVFQTLQQGNTTVAGNVLEYGEREISIQGLGFFESLEDIQNMVIGRFNDGNPILVSDIATVRISGAPRRGILANAQEEKVGGIVVMRYGENPLEVISRVKEKIPHIENRIGNEIRITPFYDRTELITGSINTLKWVLVQMVVITAFIMWVFLRHIPSTLVTGIALVFGVLLTFLVMKLFGIPSNIMSLGGIAIAIGTMVDSIIVVLENAYQHLVSASEKERNSISSRIQIVLRSTQEVGLPLLFAICIIMISFVPIFALEGMEGKLFQPLAFTSIFAMLGALLSALFFVPLGCVWFLRGRLFADEHIPAVFWFQRLYEPLLRWAFSHNKIVLGVSGVLLLGALGSSVFIGSEFMPPLDEGDIWYMPMTVPDVSERKAAELLRETNAILASFPEVKMVMGKAGRADTATDPAPLAMIETFITLKPKSEWRPGVTKEDLITQMNRSIQIPSLWNGFTQPIIGRIDMVSTGIRAQVGIKVFGTDPIDLENIALDIEQMMSHIPGASGTVALRTLGLRYLNIDIKEDQLAAYGIPKSNVLQAISVGMGGAVVSSVVEGRERYGVQLRFAHNMRDDIETIKGLPIRGLNGQLVSLDAVADIRIENGPAVLHSENGQLRSVVQMNVRGRDLVSFVEDTKTHLDENLQLPVGYRLEFDGQYKNQVRAKSKLSWVVPLVVVLIFLILYITYNDLKMVSVVMMAIPLSIIGGIAALLLSQYNFSVAVWVGFIALFGNAVETGVVIVLYLQQSLESMYKKTKRVTFSHIDEALMAGATKRLRPVLMTAFTSLLGLLPLLVTTGTGAEIQKPLAVVVLGGLLTSVIMTLLVIPVLFRVLQNGRVKKAG